MPTTIERDCVISGGGPAGMVLGFLLARAGLRVTVLEKHADFLRDFRGDTIHPSTITLLGELGLRERFLALPLSRIPSLDVVLDGTRVTMVDFGTLPPPDDFLVLAPQWEFLNFLADAGAAFPGFDLRMRTAATDLIREGDRVVGLRATGPEGEVELRAPLTVIADGRASELRAGLGARLRDFGVPIDVLWFRLPKPEEPTPPTLGYFSANGAVLTLDRGDYFQSGTIIPKGAFDGIREEGLPAFRARIASAAPHLVEVVATLVDWDQVRLLSVQVNRLDRWHAPGVIAIGDAAHAMSPMFGVGVNFAIQDAVALANAVTPHLGARGGADAVVPDAVLASVQRRREPPVRTIQRMQTFGHRALVRGPRRGRVAPRAFVRLVRLASPIVRRVAARVIGVGLRPEHAVRESQ